jgi:hypothetical protein
MEEFFGSGVFSTARADAMDAGMNERSLGRIWLVGSYQSTVFICVVICCCQALTGEDTEYLV